MLLAYENLEPIEGGVGRTMDDQPDVAFAWRADVLYLAPDPDSLIEAEITTLLRTSISLVFRGICQVNINFPAGQLPAGLEFDEKRRCFSYGEPDPSGRATRPRVWLTSGSTLVVRFERFVPREQTFSIKAQFVPPYVDGSDVNQDEEDADARADTGRRRERDDIVETARKRARSLSQASAGTDLASGKPRKAHHSLAGDDDEDDGGGDAARRDAEESASASKSASASTSTSTKKRKRRARDEGEDEDR